MGSDIVVTKEQVIALIKEEKMKPSDLFGVEALEADPIVKGLGEDRVKERIAGEYRRRKEAEEKLERIEGEKGQKEAEYLKQINDLKLNAAKSKVGSLFEKQKTDRKLDERQVKFIQTRLSKDDFKPSKPEDLEKEFNLYLDLQIDDYNRVAKDVFGVEEKPADDKTKTDSGVGPDEKKKEGPADKYLDPAQNPWIPKTEEV